MVENLYIHIPFCKTRCLYCDFYSAIYDCSFAFSYCLALVKQIEKLECKFQTIYIGGGTPTVLDKALLIKIFKGLEKFSAIDTEFTIEANPESLDEDRIKIFLDSGVNRISIGVQSLNEKKLKKLGRIHDSRRGIRSVEMAAKKGFKNISIDMIFGVWGESAEEWALDIAQAAALPVTHISCYSLAYEKSTPLFRAIQGKAVQPLEDDLVAAQYELAIESLTVGGFKQYEVSNFAKEGFRCKHNMNYWANEPYTGLGASAVSYQGGERIRFVSDAAEYLRRVDKGEGLAEFREKLSSMKKAKETAAVKIRTSDGIDFRWFKAKTGLDFMVLEGEALPRLLENDLIEYKKEKGEPSGVRLTRRGFLFCDTVSSAFL